MNATTPLPLFYPCNPRPAPHTHPQDLVKAVERRKVRHVLYTVPEVVEAGEEVTIYYNPRDTPLNGRQQLYLMGGWNRWTHKRSFGPVAMHPPEAGGEHWQVRRGVGEGGGRLFRLLSKLLRFGGCRCQPKRSRTRCKRARRSVGYALATESSTRQQSPWGAGVERGLGSG